MTLNFKKNNEISSEEKEALKATKGISMIPLGNTLIVYDFIKLLMFFVYATFATVSTLHLYDLFIIGNHIALAWSLCMAVEIASILIFIFWLERTETKLDLTFAFLVILQIFGNVFSVYTNIRVEDFGVFSEFLNMADLTLPTQKRIYAILTGVPIPLIIIGLLTKIETNKKTLKVTENKIKPLADFIINNPSLEDLTITQEPINDEEIFTPKGEEITLEEVKEVKEDNELIDSNISDEIEEENQPNRKDKIIKVINSWLKPLEGYKEDDSLKNKKIESKDISEMYNNLKDKKKPDNIISETIIKKQNNEQAK